jgi:hypothetical protein
MRIPLRFALATSLAIAGCVSDPAATMDELGDRADGVGAPERVAHIIATTELVLAPDVADALAARAERDPALESILVDVESRLTGSTSVGQREILTASFIVLATEGAAKLEGWFRWRLPELWEDHERTTDASDTRLVRSLGEIRDNIPAALAAAAR